MRVKQRGALWALSCFVLADVSDAAARREGCGIELPGYGAELPWRARRGRERNKNQSRAPDKLRHSWQIIDLSIRNGEGRFVYLPPSQ
ncbi:hypothetical protein DPEC_G00351990 [Dallia pectoralis]|uniref:Uncharacterized protein n=1 Tax=Dallia pectoralis TaxID=75939 RepID=A0ACC2F1Z6_DALPE|nr:hypothetical protein DPEC_G00351990 [Dallia pectoralis]